MKDLAHNMLRVVLALGILAVWGCGPVPDAVEQEYVIETTGVRIDRDEFLEELDLKMAAYPYDIKKHPEEYNEMVMDLIFALTEQCQLLTAAARKGIGVTKDQVDQAEARFRQDYPENSFEQVLLENAVPYPFWRKKLERSLVIDRLIQTELKEKIQISPDELVSFYKKTEARQASEGKDGLEKKDNGSELVARLRREKSQDHYNEWVQKLKQDHPATINKKEIAKFLIKPDKDKGSINE